MPNEEILTKLHADLGLKVLNPIWAKCELFLGLAIAGFGLFYGNASVGKGGTSDWPGVAVGLAQFVFGGYLAMAGHRSHIYQSNNKLAAYVISQLGNATEPGANKVRP